MNSSEREKAIFRNLFIKSIDGQNTPEEVQQFNELLSAYPDLEEYYIQCVQLQVALREIRIFSDFYMSNPPDYTNQALWKEFAEYEKTAQEVEIAKEEPGNQDEVPAEIQMVRPKISKFSVYSLLLSSAALIFLIVYAHFISMRRGIEVATLTGSMNARWADTNTSLSKGARFATGREKYFLREGLADLRFDSEAVVTLEGPAEFQILTEDQIRLYYGRLYAAVPQGAIGFTVNTPSARIIDLGTEFGIEAAAGGDTYLYVIKGKTTLIAGTQSNKVSMEVGKGIAKKVSSVTSVISDIPCDEKLFVRAFNADYKLVWKGQTRLDLTDIVGGGNGFGTGAIDTGIDPLSGKPSSESPGTRESANNYCLVPSNSFIDGVFVPNGRTQQIVSSQGHQFRECPVSSGSTYHNLTNGMRIIYAEAIQDSTATVSQSAHSLLMHANVGITYDLQAIRGFLPDVRIIRFQSKLGIEDVFLRPTLSNADFWVLVDGELRYQKTQVKVNQLFSVDIELSEKDRFLTLVVTDGKDPHERILDNVAYPAIDCDWCMFADPVLVLE